MSNNFQEITTAGAWEEKLAAHKTHHLLQNWKWGELKAQFGWQPVRLFHEPTAALVQVLLKRAPLGYTVAYVPKGPVMADPTKEKINQLFNDLHDWAKNKKSIFLKVEPDGFEEPVWDLAQYGFEVTDTVQPRRTIFISIAEEEEAILARMKSKTRYNIRLAKKKGVTVRVGEQKDIEAFSKLMQITSERDRFGIHGGAYYAAVYNQFEESERAILFAEYEGKPLATLMVLRQGEMAYYLYGGSSNEERNRMPAYILQWEAIKWAKQQGCTTYDLWGVPDEDAETLEEDFMNRRDGLWGVYRFKRGFGGELVRTPGAFDFVYKSWIYKLYKLYLRLRK